ncbi:hypothetical protein [Saccharicrinis carchari]|uniref:hypothetical protein n=1 Tax=Saccharicrinis carchari TaxID=1168039 RepID=UPI001158E2AC|nr:hypothetical protein [Saccharicrinis carchari]
MSDPYIGTGIPFESSTHALTVVASGMAIGKDILSPTDSLSKPNHPPVGDDTERHIAGKIVNNLRMGNSGYSIKFVIYTVPPQVVKWKNNVKLKV